MTQSLPHSFVKTVNRYLRRKMPEKAADECVRMARKQPFNRELLVYCSPVVLEATAKHSQQLLAVLDRYLMSHRKDPEIRKLRRILNKRIRLQMECERLDDKLTALVMRRITLAAHKPILRAVQAILVKCQRVIDNVRTKLGKEDSSDKVRKPSDRGTPRNK